MGANVLKFIDKFSAQKLFLKISLLTVVFWCVARTVTLYLDSFLKKRIFPSTFSYSMTGKLGGHAGPVMTVLLRETNKESLVFTGSRDHYVKVSLCIKSS